MADCKCDVTERTWDACVTADSDQRKINDNNKLNNSSGRHPRGNI